MFEQYKWQQVPGAQAEPFLKLVNPIQGKHTASPGTADVQWCQLPFYTSIALVKINDSSWPPNTGPFWFLAKQGRMFLLDGTSAPIHDANEADPIKVTEENTLDYLRFFCYFVHGDEGPFLIVEEINHPAIDHDKLDDTRRKVLEGALRDAMFEGKTDAGAYEASALVLYGNALFSARFSMTENGMIEMIDDEPIAADLPVKKIKPNY
ncbi:MAG: hypothetical protein OXT65_07735 [Alphaproteobacteria bacterium]|nr:hypothetical protein [Alphaproteobacteria bacterium]